MLRYFETKCKIIALIQLHIHRKIGLKESIFVFYFEQRIFLRPLTIHSQKFFHALLFEFLNEIAKTTSKIHNRSRMKKIKKDRNDLVRGPLVIVYPRPVVIWRFDLVQC